MAALDTASTGLWQPPSIVADRDTPDPTQVTPRATPGSLPHRAAGPTNPAVSTRGSLDPQARSPHASAGSSGESSSGESSGGESSGGKSSGGKSSGGGGGGDGLSGVFVLAGYEDGTVAVWDASSPSRPVASARLHSEPVMCVTCSEGGTGGDWGMEQGTSNPPVEISKFKAKPAPRSKFDRSNWAISRRQDSSVRCSHCYTQ